MSIASTWAETAVRSPTATASPATALTSVRPERARLRSASSARMRSSRLARSSCSWRSRSRRYSTAAVPVSASMRRAPAPVDASETITKGPMSPVRATCVPPQSSLEKSPVDTTRTRSPYFSSKSPIAPSSAASWRSTISHCTGWSSSTRRLTIRSISRSVSGSTRPRWVKSKRSLSGPTYEPACRTPWPSVSAQRPAEDVRGGVVGAGQAPPGAVDRGEDLALDGQLALVEADAQHLVGAQAEGVDDGRARAVVGHDLADVRHLAAALRIEGRLLELEQGRAVAELLDGDDPRVHARSRSSPTNSEAVRLARHGRDALG